MVTKEQLEEYCELVKTKYPLDDSGHIIMTSKLKNGKVKGLKKPKLFEVEQQLEYIEDMDAFKELIQSYDKYAYIVHDKDVQDDGSLKAPHIHVMISMEQGRYWMDIFKPFYKVGIKHNYISMINGQFKDALLYLTHKNAPSKYQYTDDEVVSNFDWVTAREVPDKVDRITEIIELIGDGTIKRYNKDDYISITEWSLNKTKFENAFKYVEDIKRKEVNANMECIYIQGESGSGKTTLAKHLASKKKLGVFVSGTGEDFMDGYEGQECIILDDLRPSSIGMADLLKMLDNHTNTSIKSRYYNKVMTNCQLIIITTVLDIDTFFKNVFNSENEPIIQFKRRCRTKVFVDGNKCYVSSYDAQKRDYGFSVVLDNPVYDVVQSAILTEKQHYQHLADMWGVDLESIERGAERAEMETFVPIQQSFEDIFPHGED